MPQMLGIPGVSSGRVTTARRLFVDGSAKYIAQSIVINGSLSRDPLNTSNVDYLRPGLLLGRITATNLYRPSLIGVTTGSTIAAFTAITTITAAAATVTEVARLITVAAGNVNLTLTGPSSANGPIGNLFFVATAASGTTITITSIAPSTAFIVGSFIMPRDGSELPRTILPEIDGASGVKVTDADAVSINKTLDQYPVGGNIDSSQIVSWPSDTTLQNFIVQNVNDVAGCKFFFDHRI